MADSGKIHIGVGPDHYRCFLHPDHEPVPSRDCPKGRCLLCGRFLTE